MCIRDRCIIAQIETIRAVDAIEQIGAVDGIDGLFVGPNDLAASIGLVGRTAHAQVQELIARALAKMKSTGKGRGILNFVPAESRAFLQSGFSFIAVGSDGAIVARRSEALLQEIKATP